MKKLSLTRRQALAGYASLIAAQPLVRAQNVPVPPVKELVNLEEFAPVAERRIGAHLFSEIAGTERRGLDRITLRPRMMVDTTKMDLSSTLFGQTMFMPILIGPAAEQKRFHPEGELAMVRGAAAAKAAVVIAGRSSVPIDQIAAAAKTPLWYQVYLEPDIAEVRTRVQRAAAAGCKVLCVTLGSGSGTSAGTDWHAIDRLRQGLTLPVVLKGVTSPEEAQKAVSMGVQGIMVSNYSPRPITGVATTIEMLPAVADAVGGRIPILMDGSIRLGSDVLKALALGAKAVMLARPPLWGLAGYGADGVQNVVELIQSSFARDMAMCGKNTLKELDRSVVAIHKR